MSTIANLEAAVEAAQQQTEHCRALALTFGAVAERVSLKFIGIPSEQVDSSVMGDYNFSVDQFVATEKDFHIAALAELAARRELDEARKNSLVRSPEQPALETHIADVGDDASRALCGRVGVPQVKHAATCVDCHDKMLDIARLAFGCSDQSGYQTKGGRRMYRYRLPSILARFGFAMELPFRVGEGAALQDALLAIRDGINRMLGEVQA